MPKMNDDGNALPTFKPGDLVRWIGEWQFPLVDAPPRENTVLAIENDGKVHLEGRHGSEAPQRWWCPPDQLVVHCEPVQTATLEVDNNECSACGATFSWNEGADRDEPDQLCNPCAQRIASDARKARMARTPEEAAAVKAEIRDAARARKARIEGAREYNEFLRWIGMGGAKVAERLRRIMSTCFDGSRSGDLAFQLADMEEWIPKFTSEWKANHRRWLDLCDRLGFDALDLEQRGRVAEVDAVAGEASEIKRIRNIVDEDARKRHGNREGEPSWGVIADCVLAHVSQHRQAREILDVPEQFTLDQYVSMLGDGAELVKTRQVLEAMQGRTPDPARSTIQVAREVVAQAERWRINAGYYEGEAKSLTALRVQQLSDEVARLTGEVAATRAEAARQIGARDADLAALVTRARRLATDLTSEANECTTHGLVSPATALRGAAAFLTSVGEQAPRVFSAASSVEALHQRLEEADRHLAGLQEELRRRDAIADAWCDWKKSNDPPGLTVESFEDGASWIRGTPDLKRWDSPDEARAAAWAWYDRRHRLIKRGLAHRGRGWMGLNPWPRCLTWTDEQVAEVERWLVDSTAEMPEVLRG